LADSLLEGNGDDGMKAFYIVDISSSELLPNDGKHLNGILSSMAL
jgi:hypothetical protein